VAGPPGPGEGAASEGGRYNFKGFVDLSKCLFAGTIRQEIHEINIGKATCGYARG